MTIDSNFNEFCAMTGAADFRAQFQENLAKLLKKHEFSGPASPEDFSFANFVFVRGQVPDFEITTHAQTSLFTRPGQHRDIKSLVLLITHFRIMEARREISFNVSARVTTRKNPGVYQLLAKYAFDFTGRQAREEAFLPACQRPAAGLTIT